MKLIPLSAACITAATALFSATPGAHAQQSKNKYVTVLYSTWSDYWQVAPHLKSDGQPYVQSECPPWGAYGLFHWWGRPAFASGNVLDYKFMLNGNPSTPNSALIDNHAELIYDAGVDFISIDLSNGTQTGIVNGAKALCRRLSDRKAQGLRIPRVAFFANNSTTTTTIYNTFYAGAYGDIFFQYEGKPLLLVKDQDTNTVFNNFTVRKIWGLLNQNAANEWSFKENTPINSTTPAPSYKVNGWPEERSVCAAAQGTYMTASAGRQGRQNGTYFDWHWSLSHNENPTFVFVTAWNEWGSQNLGDTTTPVFTDCYLTEYSADLEPMTGGHGTQYYDKLKTQVAAYKRNVPNLALRDSTSGTWYFKYYYSDGAFLQSNYTATFNWAAGTGYQSFVGDFNSDGYNDIGLRNTSTGVWYFAQRNTGTFAFNNNNTLTWATGAHYQPFVGDFNNDGKTDIGMRDPNNGTWYFRQASAAYSYPTQLTFTWTAGSGYEPVIADFNGDGKLDLGLRNVTTGEVRFATQNATSFTFTAQAASFNWATGTDYQSFAGDFDRDGKGDVALRRKSDGRIFLANGDGTLANFWNNDDIPYVSGTQLTAHAFKGR